MADLKYQTKILVVDDEKLIRLTVCAKLKSAGYETVAVGSASEAVAALKKNHRSFTAIISDIMMGDMDGFDFRDAVRGIDEFIPFFFMTALDPEEGSGFLKRIVEDPQSYYLPKSAGTDVLIKRVQRVVVSRRIEQFIEKQVQDTNKSLALAAQVQRSMLPVRALMTKRGFYTTWWQPKDAVSGDLIEAVPYGEGRYLYVLGDIQGHGTSAALAMTAVQAFLKNLNTRTTTMPAAGPSDIANLLQKFFRTNLAEVSYMTAFICIHSPEEDKIRWISCGAPDPIVVCEGKTLDVNPHKRGGLPIGLMPDTHYTLADEVVMAFPKPAVCIAYTDGVLDVSMKDEAVGVNTLSLEMATHFATELVDEGRKDGSMIAVPWRVMRANEECGYTQYQDDVTSLMFGAHLHLDGIFEATVGLSPENVDFLAQDIGAWCAKEGWDESLVQVVQLVLEEKIMNIYDHGYDDRERTHEVASIRLRRGRGDGADLTVWDCGTPEPSIEVAAGDAGTAFELVNRAMGNHGRGRLMLREICDGIERRRYGKMNETVYHIPAQGGGGGLPRREARGKA